MQKTPNGQSNLEKVKQSWRVDFRLYYKATVIKYSMVLAQKQKYRSMAQETKFRDKPTLWHPWSPNL